MIATPRPIPSLLIPLMDALRGIAALAVVCFHARDIIVSATPTLANVISLAWFGQGYLGVELFFVISGYCIAATAVSGLERGKGIAAFAGARVRRIFPPYLISLALVILVGMGMLFLVHRGVIAASKTATAAAHLTPTALGANLTLTQLAFGIPSLSIVSWTLCYEVAFYAVCAIALGVAAMLRQGSRFFLRLLHAITVVILVIQIAMPGKLGYPMDMWAMFGLGAVLFDVVRAERVAAAEQREAGGWLAGLALLTIVAMVRGVGSRISIMNHSAPLAFGVALGSMALLYLVRQIPETIAYSRIGRPFSRIGTFSYSLYLIHFLCLGLASQTLHLAHIPDTWYLLRFVMLVLTAITGGFIFYLLFERPFLPTKRQPLSPNTVSEAVPVP